MVDACNEYMTFSFNINDNNILNKNFYLFYYNLKIIIKLKYLLTLNLYLITNLKYGI